MLVSLGPGLFSLMPNLKLSPQLAVTPLVNCVLLARDTFSGEASASLALVVVVSTALYALAAIGVAARIFGADAILYGGHGHWSDLFRRPSHTVNTPTVANAVLCLALMFPAFFVLSNWLARSELLSVSVRLVMSGLITALLFGAFPLVAAYVGRVRITTGFRLRAAPAVAWLSAILLGFSLWPLAHELFVLTASLEPEQIERVTKLLADWKSLPPALILLTMAVAPAVFEEFFFRGYLFSSLRAKVSPWQTIVVSALLFGAFHVVTNTLATERFLPSTCLGLVLGWVCYRSGSVLPGMLLHSCHNGFLLLAARYQDELKAAGWDLPEQSHLPIAWLAASVAVVALGLTLLRFCRGAAELQAAQPDEQ